MQTLKMGFIGAGFVANFHATSLKMVRGLELAGVHALKGSENLASVAKANELGSCKVCSSVAQLCEQLTDTFFFSHIT